MSSAAQRVQAEAIASIALFMLLAAVVTPEPTPRGVGLRGTSRHHAAPVEILRPVRVRPAQAITCPPLAPGSTRDTASSTCEGAGIARVPAR